MENRLKAYKQALEREIKVLSFYREKSNLSKSSSAQLMFAAIAKEEEFHIERIKSILNGLEAKEDIDFLTVFAQRKAQQELKSLLKKSKAEISVPSEGEIQEELNALETAIRYEKEGIFLLLEHGG